MRRGIASPRAAQTGVCALLALAAGTAAGQQTPAPGAPRTTPPFEAPAPRPVPPMATPAAAAVFPIRGFQVDGDNPLGEAETQQVLAPFVRQDATIQTLQQATTALEAALRARGFGLHRVALPPQEVGQAVKLNIVKFVLGKVAIEGRQIYDEGNVRRTLPELREGDSPNFKRLAIQTAIANENANKQVQVGLRESEEPDKIDATITVRELRPWNIGVSASNAGSDATGHDRVTLTAAHSNVLNLDHQFIGAYTTSLERPRDVRQLGVAYKVPLYAQGGVIGASYTRSDVVGTFGDFTSTGAGHTFGVNYTKYLAPQGGRRSYVTVGIDDKLFEPAVLSGFASTQTARRSRPITVSYTARTETDTSVWGYNADLAFNTGWGAHNDLDSYRTEDPRIDTVHWKAIRGGASYTAPLAQTWLWSARGQFQYSPDVLIAGEQFGLGGLGSVRGTELERVISADKGVSATFEVTTPELVAGLRLLGFFDAGHVWNNNPGGGKPASDRIASVGLGLRYGLGMFAASLDYGRLVQGSRIPVSANPNSPQRGDDRFYVNVSVRF